MKIRVFGVAIVLALVAGMDPSLARADVDLELRTVSEVVALGNVVEVDLFAVSTEGTEFTALDVILAWDSTLLELLEVVNTSPHSWEFMYGLPPDSQLDGLNDSLLDGNALFQAASFSFATATSIGLRVATFRFATLAVTDLAEVAIEPSHGARTRTQVLQPDVGDVTGVLGSSSLSVVLAPLLGVWDMFVPAGRTDALVVYGEIDGDLTFGVTVVLEVKPRAGNGGTVAFTAAPPVDVFQLEDVWPGVGTFNPLDTDISLSSQLNGAIDDNGRFLVSPVAFSGVLAGFPLTTSVDAAGVWDLVLSVDGTESWWEGLLTSRRPGTLTVVSLGDGNGDDAIDFSDFAQLQLCFGGELGRYVPLGDSSLPGPPCGVYDFDDNGVIDIADYAALNAVLSGPSP